MYVDDLIYGESDRRIKLLPDVVKRINDAGHFCAYTMIDGENMKKMHWKDFYLQIMVNPRYEGCGKGRGQLSINFVVFYSFHVF